MDTIKEVESARNVLNRREEMLDDSTLQAVREAAVRQKDLANIGNLDTDLNNLYTKAKTAHSNWTSGAIDTNTFLSEYDSVYKEARKLSNVLNRVSLYTDDAGDYVKQTKDSLAQVISSVYSANLSLKKDGKVLFNNYADVQKAEEEYKSYLYEESEYEEYKNAMKERERILEYYKSQSSEMLTEEQWRGKAHDMIFFSKYPTYQAYLDAYRKGEVQAEVEKRQAYATEYDNKLSAITNKGKYATTSQQGDVVYNRADWYGRYQYETLYELYGNTPEYEQTVEEGKKLSSGYKVDEKDIKAPMSTGENLERLNALELQSKYANTDVQYINPQYADMYYYLLAAQGPEAANEYLSNFEGYINYLKGYIRAEDMKDAGMIRNAVLDVQAGLNGFFRGIETFLFPGDYNPRTSSEIAFAAHREDRSWIGRLAGDVLMNIAQNAPSQLLSAAGFKALGYASFFATAAGNAYTTAQEMGATTEQASAYSMIIGASETLLEKLLSGLEYTGGTLKNAIFGSSAVEFAETTGQALWNVAKNYGANVLGEFTEEYLQEVLEPVFRNICFDENNEFKFFTVDALYAGVIGALSAASQVRNIRGFASDMNQAVYFAKTGQEFLKYEDTTQLIDNAMKLGGEVSEYARNLPENPTAYQIGTLAAMSGQQRTQLGMVHQLFESIGYKVKIVDTLTPAKMETKRGKKSQQTISPDKIVNGEIGKESKTVTIARDAPKLLQWTSKHEVMHSIEGTPLYAKLKESILTSKHLSDILSQNGLTVEEAINGYAEALTRKTGKEYTYEQAEKEFLGDYVAEFLFNREDYARELVGVYAPLGQKIAQALGNVRKAAFGSKEERYFAQAQNTFLKAMEQVKEIRPNDTADAIKTNETQESISSFFDALGIEVSPVGKYGISVSEKVTPEIVENSNLGKVLNYAVKQGNITQADKAKQVDFLVQLSNMIRESPNPRMLWEFIGSNAFSAITANSDPQYVSTIDFGTVCVKTQELINKMSKAMVEKAKRNNGFGALTKEEITALYNETGRQGYLTNCPQCYVFQRWVGLGSRLNDVTLYQKKYGSLTYDECEKIVRQVDAWMDNAEEIIGQKLSESANVKEKLIQYFERNGRSDDAELVRAFSWFTGTRVNRKNNKGKISYSPYAQNKNGFEVVPAEILYDYNAGDAFVRKYPLTWKYRTSGGSAYGKAIQPYTEMTLGEVARGVSNTEDVVEKNAKKFTYDDPRALKNADKNVRSQNLRGGQRMNSTSDFMYAHGLDYLLALMELQALGSNVQLYTKVTESLPMLCAAGADCNISLMPEGRGYVENGDGTYKLQLSSIQGVDPNTANAIARMYANAQLIMVGINDIAIKLALSGDAITFVIPYHASGGEAAFVTALMNALGEAEVDKNFIYDYTKMQSDHILTNYKAKYSNLSDAEIETLKERHSRLRKIREGIINGKAIVNGKRNSTSKQGAFSLTADDLSLIFDESQNGRPYIEQLLIRYYGVNSMLQEVYSPDVGVVMKDKSAEQIFPYEYWDTTSTIDTADINGVRFVEYCESLGIVPRFSGMDSSGKKVTKVVGKDRVEYGNFAYEVQEDGSVRPTKGYWKLLIDRPMYNIAYDAKGNPVENFGAYRNQQKINITNIKPQMFVPEFEMTEANRKRYFVQADTQNADLGNFYSTMDTYYGVVNAFAAAKNKQSNPYDRFNLQNELNNLGYSSTYDLVNQISAGKSVLNSVGNGYFAELYSDYLDLAKDPNSLKNQREMRGLVDEAALEWGAVEKDGKPITLYHGTGRFGFTQFRRGNIFLTDSETTASGYGSDYGYANPRRISDKYIEDDGTADTLIKNAKSILGQEMREVEDRDIERVRSEFRKSADSLSEEVNNAWSFGDGFPEPNRRIENGIAWMLSLPGTVSENLDDILNGDYSVLDDVKHFEDYREDVRKWFADHKDEIIAAGNEDLYRLITGFKLTDFAIDVAFTLEKAANREESLVNKRGKLVSKNDVREDIERSKSLGAYSLFANLGSNPLVIDCDGAFWASIPVPDSINTRGERYTTTTSSIADMAKKAGYTGVVFENVYDPSMNNFAVNERSNVYAVFDSSQVKSADLVTYDNDGNVIPLSQRFGDSQDIRYSIGDMSFEQMLAEIANEYGKMPPPNQPQRDVVYPKEISVNGKKRRVSRFAQTGAANTSEGTGEEVARRVLSGEATYTPTSNAANMSSAEYLRKGFVDDERSTGYEKALSQVDAQTNINYMPTAQDIAFAELMIMEADNMGDSETASRLIAQTAVLATRAGQAVQALSLIKKLGNQGRLYVLEQQINNINRNLTDAQRKTFVNDYIKEAEGLAKELLEYRQKLQDGSVTEEDRKSIMKKVTETLGKTDEKADVDTVDQVTELIERLTAKLTEEQKEAVKKNGGVKLSEETKKKILEAKTPQELEDAVLDATKEIGMQIPATFRDKWNAWRYMAMLVNPVTHLRNTISNAFMVPLAMSQNAISRAFGNTDRSGWLKKEYKDAAERIMKDNAFKKLMEGSKYDEYGGIGENRRIFKNKVLEWIRTANGNALSAEDVFFKKIYFKRALAGYMQRHNIAADTKIEHLTRALEYAANEANVNTFNNESKLANDINKFAKGGSWAREFIINGIIPFKRTPINILKQSLMYSPFGFAKVASQLASKNRNANAVFDTLASSLTGTALSMVGAWMYLSGALTLGLGDDKDDEFAKLQGVQEYSLRIGDKYFSIDWLAPSAVPVFLGAELARFIFENTDGTPDELWSALKRTVTPVLEMSMLQGIQNTLDSLVYGQKGEKLQDALASIFESYLSQALPTFFGKVNNITNDTQKMGYADKNSPIPTTVQKFLQKISKKIPYFGKYALTDYLDRWGREVSTGNVVERIAENFVFPGYISEENTSDMEKELQRLYDSTGKTTILPGANARSTTIKTADGSHEIQFTADEYRAFNMARKGMAYNALTELTDSDYYKSLDDEEKVKAINFVWDATLDIAKVGVAYSRGLELDMEKATQALEADEGMDLIMYYRIYNAGTTQDARRQAMSDLGLTDKQKEKLWKVLYPDAATDYKGYKIPKEQRGNK